MGGEVATQSEDGHGHARSHGLLNHACKCHHTPERVNNQLCKFGHKGGRPRLLLHFAYVFATTPLKAYFTSTLP